MRFALIFLLVFMMFTACADRTLDDFDPVLTEIHLQSGFFGQVTIWVDDEKVYDEAMSSHVPFNGPQNLFTLSMTRGTNSVKVSWGASGAQMTDESAVRIGSSDEYFLGIQIIDGTITLKLQTFEFVYM